jgi:hypothetical protein
MVRYARTGLSLEAARKHVGKSRRARAKLIMSASYDLAVARSIGFKNGPW